MAIRPSSAAPPSTAPPAPLQRVTLHKSDLDDPSLSLLNNILTNYQQVLNRLQGFSGPIRFNDDLDMAGSRISNVGDATAAGDVVSQAFANSKYSAPALRPQLEANGGYGMQSYRQLSSPNQREKYSSFLNQLLVVSPTSNSSTVTFGPASGGFVPVTISAGYQYFTDGHVEPYLAYNDSLQVPTTYTISTLTRSGGVVSGSTTGSNTLTTGETVVVAGASDPSFDGQFVLASSSSPNFTYNQSASNSSSTGGSISLNGVYFYIRTSGAETLTRVGPYFADTWQNRITTPSGGNQVPSIDGSTIIAVVTVNSNGGDYVNSCAGATLPAQNAGAPTRLFGRL